MSKFTEADFPSTITIQQPQPRRPRKKLTIVIPRLGKLCLPVAPPSPFFDGMNEDINIEPFPKFIDPCPPVKAEPMHCILHCAHRICRTMIARGSFTECRCGDEVFQTELDVSTPIHKVPVGALNDALLDTISDNLSLDPSQIIDVRYEDAKQLLKELKILIINRLREDEEFMNTISNFLPNHQSNQIASATIETFFDLMMLYLQRTLSSTKQRSICIRDLQIELKLYAWTGFKESIVEYCDVETEELIEANMNHESQIMEAANFGLPGEVSKIWQECLDHVVEVLVWRDSEVRQSRANFKIASFLMAALSGYALAAGTTYMCGYR